MLGSQGVFFVVCRCVVIDGVDLVAARRCLIHWLHEFGLSSSKVAVTLVTDSEAAVSEFRHQRE